MPRLFLIDGSSQMYRAYHAIRGLTGPDGRSTNAVYGFATMLRKLIADQSPEYIAASFDLPGRTFRDDLSATYKANRAPMPSDLAEQVPLVHEAPAFSCPRLPDVVHLAPARLVQATDFRAIDSLGRRWIERRAAEHDERGDRRVDDHCRGAGDAEVQLLLVLVLTAQRIVAGGPGEREDDRGRPCPNAHSGNDIHWSVF